MPTCLHLQQEKNKQQKGERDRQRRGPVQSTDPWPKSLSISTKLESGASDEMKRTDLILIISDGLGLSREPTTLHGASWFALGKISEDPTPSSPAVFQIVLYISYFQSPMGPLRSLFCNRVKQIGIQFSFAILHAHPFKLFNFFYIVFFSFSFFLFPFFFGDKTLMMSYDGLHFSLFFFEIKMIV